MFRFCLTIGLMFVSVVLCQRVPENPCPNIFAYRQQRGVYYGEIAIPYDGTKNLNLAVNISMVGLYQNVKLRLELLTPPDQIMNSQYLRYRVTFPLRNVIPKITQISFNDRIFCYGPPEPISTNGVTNLWANIVYRIKEYTYSIQSGLQEPYDNSNNLNNNYNEPISNPFISPNESPVDTANVAIPSTTSPLKSESCGTANNVQTLVLKGEKTAQNEYPWLVAMFERIRVTYNFKCTANLISNRHVITAAHCVWILKAPLVDKDDILLVLGSSDISHWASTGAIIRTALEVIPHPNYKQNSGHCDLAIIKMNEEVIFKPSVRPICLWNEDTALKRIVGSDGVVAGWGKSEENNIVVALPRKISIPIVSQETCLRSHTDFINLTSNMTFCAGNKDGSGPCSGDSGAGFMINKNGKWYLRGLVSTAIKKEDYSCNLDEYIVFADIAKLKDWIKLIIK